MNLKKGTADVGGLSRRSAPPDMIHIAKRLAALPPDKKITFEAALREKGIDRWDLPIVSQPKTLRPVPLSYAQQRLWFLEQLEPGKSLYNLFFALRLTGPLDLRVLEQAINAIIHRHDILRTNVVSADGEGAQVVQPFEPVPVPFEDLTSADPATRPSRLRDLAKEEAETAFDLARDRLFRVRIVACSPSEHVLMLTVHHLIFDAWSQALITDELGYFYEVLRAGSATALDPLPIQYADFALWQREWMESEHVEVERAYWMQQLQDPPVLMLPCDHPRPAKPTFEGGHATLTLSPTLTRKIYALCRQRGATLYMVMLATFKVLLARYSGQDDICVGTSIANRPRPETAHLIGFLVNTLVMRTRLTGDPAFLDCVDRVKEVASQAYVHQNMPFEMLVDLLGLKRNPVYSPLFQVFFVLEHVPDRGHMNLAGVTVEPLDVEQGMARFDVTLRIAETEAHDTLHCDLEYSTDLFTRSTIVRMLQRYEILLEAFTEDPQARLSEVSLLSEVERQQLLPGGILSDDLGSSRHCIHQLVEAQALRNPDGAAVISDDLVLTYGELDRRAAHLAGYLQTLGVGPEARVALCLERSADMIIGLLGVLKAGGVYVPCDPAFPDARIAYMLADSGARVVLTREQWTDRFSRLEAQAIALDREWPAIEAQASESVARMVRPQNLAYIIYTSGSTGRPKGVAVEHRQLACYVAALLERVPLSADASFAAISTVAADLGHTSIFGALCSGRPLHIISEERGFDPHAVADYLSTHQVEVLKIVPGHLSALLEVMRPERVLPRHCLILGGEALRPALAGRIRALAPACTIVNHYGPTEATVGALTHRVTDNDAMGTTIPVGRPLSNVEAYILDPWHQPAPVGVPGELYLGGSGLARGYLGRPDLTAERFIPNSFSEQPGSRLYRTGDRARYRLDGTIEFLGRLDNQVKVRGYRIEPGEIEAQLRRDISIKDAVVVVRDRADEAKELIAYVVGMDGVDPAALRSRLAGQLPDYMIPHAFVTLPAFPLTTNGKVDRAALPDHTGQHVLRKSEHGAPRNPTEERLAEIWREVLHADEVGRDDNFFDLGGDSILSLQIIARARKRDILLTPKQLFEHQTIALLAALPGIHTLDSQPSLASADHGRRAPLSYAQQRLWFLWEMDPTNAAYNVWHAVRLKGTLKVERLRRTFDAIVSRHATLRTTFGTDGGQPYQVIHPAEPVDMVVTDLTDGPPAEREQQARAMVEDEGRKPFDLKRGPLLRVTVLKLDEGDHLLTVAMHHIVSDGWSMNIIMEEFASLYEAYGSGREPALPPLRIHYVDFAVWQRRWLEAGELDRQLQYWKGRLGTEHPPMPLPADRPRPAVQRYEGASSQFEIEPDLTSRLKALAKSQEATLSMLLLTAFNILLYRYTGEVDVRIGMPVTNRTRVESEGLIGCFVNTLVIRTNLSGNLTVAEFLQRVKAEVLEAQSHQDLPFERLVEALNPQRSLASHPLVQVVYNHQWRKYDVLQTLTDLSIESLPYEGDRTQFDLVLDTEETAGQVFASLTYSTALFERNTIERVARHWITLLEGMAENPCERIDRVSILTREESAHVMQEWSAPSCDLSGAPCHQLIEAQAASQPDRPAVVFEETVLTYGELNARANQLAHLLLRHAVGPDVLVGICLERSQDLPVAMLAVWKAGGAYVPLDPSYPRERLAYMLDDARMPVVLTQEKLRDAVARPGVHPVCLDDPEQWASESRSNPAARRSSNALAYVIYTSGSTGRPKGVMIRHSSLVNFLLSMQATLRLTADEVVAATTSVSFDIAVLELFLPLLAGARTVVLSREVIVDGERLSQELVRAGATLMQATPSGWRMLLNAGSSPRLRVLCGGEAFPRELAREFLANDLETWNLYGPTETTVWSMMTPVTGAGEAVPLGRPIANTQIYLLDAALNVVPVGVPGELYIGGDGLARGYWQRPDLTAERFVPDPFGREPGGRLYRTGDQARYRSDGTVDFLGRVDHQVKLRGHRIELGEIESCLNSHPQVEQSIVLARRDDEDTRLVAYVQPAPGSPVSEQHLRTLLQAHLPGYMVPSIFVFLEAFPLTPNGKVDRKALPPPGRARAVDRQAAPQGAVEDMLAGIWEEALGVTPIGRHDNFFDLGGHSMVATQVISRIRTALQVELPLRRLFDAPTLAGLAAAVESAQAAASGTHLPPLVRCDRGSPAPLSFAQQRLWFLWQMEPASPLYNMAMALRLTGTLDVPALQQSLDQLVRRHESLRTIFVMVGSEPRQLIMPELALPIQTVDLRHVPIDDRAGRVQCLAEEATRQPFDLTTGPLLRLSLLRVGEEEHVLLFTLHHIVSDGWSMNILIREITRSYRGFFAGDRPSLPPLPIQYADYALWQRQWLQGAILENQLGYWTQQLKNSPVLSLPTDRPRPAVQTYSGATCGVALSSAVTEPLKAFSRRHGVTLFMTLLAGLKVLLKYETGQHDIVVGTDVANRHIGETENIVGFFVNQLVLRTSVDEELTFPALVDRVRDVTLAGHAHQDVPFDLVVAAVQPKRDLSYPPLFQVKLVLQNMAPPPVDPAGLQLSQLEVEKQTSELDLVLTLEESSDGLSGWWEYNTDLFDRARIERLAGHFTLLAERIAAGSDLSLKALEERLAESDSREQSRKHEQRHEANHLRLKHIKRKAVDPSPYDRARFTDDRRDATEPRHQNVHKS